MAPLRKPWLWMARRRAFAGGRGRVITGLVVVAGLAVVALALYEAVVALQARDDGDDGLWRGDRPAPRWPTTNGTLPRVAACARIRNEARYLREWIEFHRLVGIEHFYFFDDDSRDETRRVLEPYVDAGVASVWPVSPTPCPPAKKRHGPCADRTNDAEHGERGFRDECLLWNPAGADWIAMLDVDEYAFPSTDRRLPEHLSTHCDPRVAYVLVRWHMFGSGGHRRRPADHLSTIEAYRERGRADDRGCYPRLTCGDEYSPPICAKVIARPECVVRQGTHYVVEARVNDRCASLYGPEASGRLTGKLQAPLASSDWARAQHHACARPIHLNHYAVRSREDYVEKFERGRISSGARDAQKGLATKDEATGATTRTLPADVVADFLSAEVVDSASKKKKANAAATRAELMLAEFARRDHSDVLDETILKYAPQLRAALLRGVGDAAETAPPPPPPTTTRHHAPLISPRLTWACDDHHGAASLRTVTSSNHSGGSTSTLRADLAEVLAERGPRDAARIGASLADAAQRFFREEEAARQSSSSSTATRTRPHRLTLFAHIPKTAGTTLNLILADAVRREGHTFCDMGFAEIDRPSRRRSLARTCDVISAETDPSILPTLQQRAVLVVTFLREPLSRAASQIEHHLAEGRIGVSPAAGDGVLDRARVLTSPSLCPQLERDALCSRLSHERKCRYGGWCGLFQNHQTQVLAGAQHLSHDASAAVRRSSKNLLCVAATNVRALTLIGLTERFDASLCLLFEHLNYASLFEACCTAPATTTTTTTSSGGQRSPCPVFALRATKHSAADRTKATAANSSYLARYLESDPMLLALYEGNKLDCSLYDLASSIFAREPASHLFPPAAKSTSSDQSFCADEDQRFSRRTGASPPRGDATVQLPSGTRTPTQPPRPANAPWRSRTLFTGEPPTDCAKTPVLPVNY